MFISQLDYRIGTHQCTYKATKDQLGGGRFNDLKLGGSNVGYCRYILNCFQMLQESLLGSCPQPREVACSFRWFFKSTCPLICSIQVDCYRCSNYCAILCQLSMVSMLVGRGNCLILCMFFKWTIYVSCEIACYFLWRIFIHITLQGGSVVW